MPRGDLDVRAREPPSTRTCLKLIATDLERGRVIDWGNRCELVTGEIQPFADAFSTKHQEWNATYCGSQSQHWLPATNDAVTRTQERYSP